MRCKYKEKGMKKVKEVVSKGKYRRRRSESKVCEVRKLSR
jgi:hypothetical protein